MVLWVYLSLFLTDSKLVLTFIPGDRFHQPVAIRVNPEQQIFIVDRKESKVFVFDKQGQFVFAVGTPGQGPGEFNHPADVGFLSDGRIIVADAGNRRFQFFSQEGQFQNSVNVPDPLGPMLVLPGDQILIASLHAIDWQRSNKKDTARFGRYDLEGKLISRFGSTKDHDNPLMNAYMNRGFFAALGSKIVFAASITPDLIIYDGDQKIDLSYPLRFEPQVPKGSMKQVETEGGESVPMASMTYDTLCRGLAVLSPTELLILRSTEAGKEPQNELLRINLDGKPVHRYSGQFQASAMAVSPDHLYAYLVNELEENTAITRVRLE